MTSKVFQLAVLNLCFTLVAGCASAQSDPVSGTWTGDWGPTPTHRNPVTVELRWDGDTLTGTVNPGAEAIPLTNASFDPATGMVTIEAEAPHDGETYHYTIEGQVDGNTMTGSLGHDHGLDGDFRVTRS